MIVRNEEENLPKCLASVDGIFYEIVIIDTGSTDRTKEIAREFGAKVFDFPWIDDFAAARNEALAHATGDFAFWLDADDVVDPLEREKLVAILQRLRAGQHAAFVVRCECDPSPDGTGGHTVVDHIRLFPLRPDVRWTYRVHEQILPALNRAKIPVHWTDLTVRHTGYVDKALRARKLDRDWGILDASWRSGRMIRSCCLTWVSSPSRGARGPRRLISSSGAWPARHRRIRSCASCLPRSAVCSR